MPLDDLDLPGIDVLDLDELDELLLSEQYGNCTGEIGPLSQTVSCPCTGEITSGSAVAFCTGEIGDGTVAAPTDGLAVHLGQGQVVVTWHHVDVATVNRFEVYVGFSNVGPFFPYPIPMSNATTVMLNNVPMGVTIFLQVRAVGHNGSVSAFSSVKRGVFAPIEGTLQVKAVSGTIINAGVRFSALHPKSGELITFKAVDQILVS